MDLTGKTIIKEYSNQTMEQLLGSMEKYLQTAKGQFGYAIARNTRKIGEACEEYLKIQQDLINELGQKEKDENGNFTGNCFEVGTGTITPLYIIKFNSSSTYGHVFEGNMAPNLANANVCALCTFNTAILRKMSQLYCQYISLNANSNNTYTLGSKYS